MLSDGTGHVRDDLTPLHHAPTRVEPPDSLGLSGRPGVNVEREGLFTGTRGQQIAGRFGLISTIAFPYQQEWKGLVATLEDALRLHRHTPGTLVGLDRYLHQRTGGMIGSLSHLIRGAAIQATLDGSEQITKHTLDSVDLDHAAQNGNPTARTRRRSDQP